MNYELEVSRSQPAAFDTLNGTRPPLVAGSGTSTLLSAPRTIPFSAWNKGEEDVAFTLETWHLPLTNTGELIVMGHITEGLFWDGDEYILRVIYTDDTMIESRWRPVEVKARHLVVTYDVGSFTVFADAVPVITLEAIRDKPFKSVSPITLNNGTGTGQYDSAALYYRALPYSEILAHFTWGRAVAPARDIAAANGGTTWTLSSVDENKYDTIIYDESSWNLGNAQGVSYFKDIVAESEAGGTWQVALPVNTRDAAVLGGIALSYAGQGITMSYSTDGVAWTVTPNRSVIMQDAVADGSMLFLQFVLADGDAWLNSVTVDILANREMPAHSGQRVLSFRSAHMDSDLANQLEYQSGWGANLAPSAGSGLFVAPDGATTGAVELWFKRRSNSASWAGIVDTQTNAGVGGPYLGYNGSALEFGSGLVYVNGVSVTTGTQLEANVWHHIVFSFFTPSDLTITVGSNRGRAGTSAADGSIGHVALYPGAISAAQAASLYQQNMGASILRVDDTSQITLSEEVGGPKFFANSWSYVSGGI